MVTTGSKGPANTGSNPVLTTRLCGGKAHTPQWRGLLQVRILPWPQNHFVDVNKMILEKTEVV
jgi:hypothetical protein